MDIGRRPLIYEGSARQTCREAYPEVKRRPVAGCASLSQEQSEVSKPMNLSTSRSKELSAPPSAVWAGIAHIENAADRISAIKRVEVLEPGTAESLIGLKWRETREWMGRDAVEAMWITESSEASFYETRAESHGCVFQEK